MKKQEIAEKMMGKYMSKRADARKTGGHIQYKTHSEMYGKKGKMSLKSTGKNEGEHNYLGKNENNRA